MIGCGNISVMHLDSVTHLEGMELAAVCDVKRERAEAAAEKYHTKAYTDYTELLERKSRMRCICACLIICIFLRRGRR